MDSEKENEILTFWEDKKIFEKSLKEGPKPRGFFKKRKKFIFFEGPPFANGLPHHGHLLVSTIKDVVGRYKTMKGFVVDRIWGWDCHGFPIESEVSKILGVSSKKEIEDVGLIRFSSEARKSIFKYVKEWEVIIKRLGRWVDMKNTYKTMDNSFIESVWNVFCRINDKGLVKKVHRVFHISPAFETTLSNLEVTQGYKDIEDLSAYVIFPLKNDSRFLVAWTTTPWTLPGNVALAVNPKIDYVDVEKNGKTYVVAKDLLKDVFVDEDVKILNEFKGSELVNKEYEPLFNYFSDIGWKVYPADFVTSDDGTGIVHIAPGFGEDDNNLSIKHSLPTILHVNLQGKFTEDIKDFAGLEVKPKDNPKETDEKIVKFLEEKQKILRTKLIIHSYPHCWRSGCPLINYATESWVIEMPKIRNKLISENQKIQWVPEHIKDGRFGKWLEGAPDWSISRDRYWGTPLPIWENNGDYIFVDSVKTLKNYMKCSKNEYTFIRHGESESNVKNVVWTKKDGYPLTEKGTTQAQKAGDELKDKVDIIITSPLERTRQTAYEIAKKCGLKEEDIIFDDRLRERGVCSTCDGVKKWSEIGIKAEWEAKTMNDLYEIADPDSFESYGSIIDRVTDALYEYEEKYKNKKILVVTHKVVCTTANLVSDSLVYKDAIEFFKDSEKYWSRFKENCAYLKVDFKPIPRNEEGHIDLHRPYIDDVVLIKDGKEYKRISYIFDCWFESGSMPYGSTHYPFYDSGFDPINNKEFPADFIVEGIDQTRGWFNSLLSVSVAAFGKMSYKTAVANGLVLEESGKKKLSKSQKNFTDPTVLMEKYGADSFRYYLMSSPIVRGEPLPFSEKKIDEVRKKLINRLLNSVTFYNLCKKEGDKTSISSSNILDKWILSRLNETIKEVTENLEKYYIDKAARPLNDFVDDLSTWYIRRSREVMKSKDGEQSRAVLRFVLIEFAKICAPYIPFTSEFIYKEIGDNEKESIHLFAWPQDGNIDKKLLESMASVRKIVTEALDLRQNAEIKVRQPLSKLSISKGIIDLEKYGEIIKEEVNVKSIVEDGGETKLDTEITKELQEEGRIRDFVRFVQDARKKKKLNQNSVVVLNVNTDEDFLSLIKKWEDYIKKTANVSDIKLDGSIDNSTETKIGDSNISISI